MALGEVRLAGVAQGLCGPDGRGSGGRGDGPDARLVRRGLGLSRRFQFSLRSLLVLVVVVAVPCSWLAVEMKKAREQKEAVENSARLNALIRRL